MADFVRPLGCTCGAQAPLSDADSDFVDPLGGERVALSQGDVTSGDPHPEAPKLRDLLDALDRLKEDFERRLADVAAEPEASLPQSQGLTVSDLLQPFVDLKPQRLLASYGARAEVSGVPDREVAKKKRFFIKRLDIAVDAFQGPVELLRGPDPRAAGAAQPERARPAGR